MVGWCGLIALREEFVEGVAWLCSRRDDQATILDHGFEWVLDEEDTLETRLLADKEYCTLYSIYRNLLGREDNSTEAIYALFMQTVRDRVLPEIIEQARGEGF